MRASPCTEGRDGDCAVGWHVSLEQQQDTNRKTIVHGRLWQRTRLVVTSDSLFMSSPVRMRS